VFYKQVAAMRLRKLINLLPLIYKQVAAMRLQKLINLPACDLQTGRGYAAVSSMGATCL
jgi:hypothetical protein